MRSLKEGFGCSYPLVCTNGVGVGVRVAHYKSLPPILHLESGEKYKYLKPMTTAATIAALSNNTTATATKDNNNNNNNNNNNDDDDSN